MDLGSPKFLFVALLFLILITVFPIIYMSFDFITANWMYLFIAIVGIGTFYFFLKFIITKGGSGEAKAFHNIP